MTEIPESEELASKWVQELFVRKDKLQDSFHTHGDFFKGNDIERLEPIEIPRRKTDLFNWLFWIAVTLLPILYFILNLILSGKILHFAIGSSILFVCKFQIRICVLYDNYLTFFPLFLVYMLMQKVIGMSKISKSSSYGSKAEVKKDN